MESITSRKNPIIKRLRALAADAALRRDTGETVLDGLKLLGEAMASGAVITAVLAGEGTALPEGLEGRLAAEGAGLLRAPDALVSYASPVMNSPGPVFSVRLPSRPAPERPELAVVLEDVQDPGNVGTVIRTANAFGFDAVILTGGCADPTSPRAVRATMGAAFRQCVLELAPEELAGRLVAWKMPMFGAALGAGAMDIREMPRGRAAVAIGNEGHGLSGGLKAMCDGLIIIAMAPGSESLNAAMAAAVAMWELARDRIGVN